MHTWSVKPLPVGFELHSDIRDVKRLARGKSIDQRQRLNRDFGKGRWRKMKGTALVKYPSGEICRAELHWFEAHGIGKREIKVKRPL